MFDACQQRREVLDRVVRLQIRSLIGDQPVAECVALVKCVVSELFNNVEQLLAEGDAVASCFAPFLEFLTFGHHQIALLFTAGLPKVVGLGKRVASELLSDAHHALLIDHETEGVVENLAGIFMEKIDWLTTIFSIGVVVVHVLTHRTWPVQRKHSGDIFKRVRRHPPK